MARFIYPKTKGKIKKTAFLDLRDECGLVIRIGIVGIVPKELKEIDIVEKVSDGKSNVPVDKSCELGRVVTANGNEAAIELGIDAFLKSGPVSLFGRVKRKPK